MRNSNQEHCLGSMQEEEDLPVAVVPGSLEANENNPFLSSLQQSGISVTGTHSTCGSVTLREHQCDRAKLTKLRGIMRCVDCCAWLCHIFFHAGLAVRMHIDCTNAY